MPSLIFIQWTRPDGESLVCRFTNCLANGPSIIVLANVRNKQGATVPHVVTPNPAMLLALTARRAAALHLLATTSKHLQN